MVSRDTVEVDVLVTTDEALAELQDFSSKVDELGSRWQRLKLTIQNESRKVLSSLVGVVNLVRNVLEMCGISFGAFGDALLAIIAQVVATAASIMAVYTALGIANPLFWVSASISAAALGIAIGAQINAARGVEEGKRQAAQTQAILSNLQSIIGPWRY